MKVKTISILSTLRSFVRFVFLLRSLNEQEKQTRHFFLKWNNSEKHFQRPWEVAIYFFGRYVGRNEYAALFGISQDIEALS